ncbi:hypothetical protein BVI434_3060008 [Burkholderia vietnamiensis]|nr:hypothetical protein BVI434_3060008 [Burkholderia vietnamiensis]
MRFRPERGGPCGSKRVARCTGRMNGASRCRSAIPRTRSCRHASSEPPRALVESGGAWRVRAAARRRLRPPWSRVRTREIETAVRRDVHVGRRPARAQDDARAERVEDAVLQQIVANVDRDDFTEHQRGRRLAAAMIAQRDHVGDLAFEVDAAFRDARHVDETRRNRGEPAEFEFVHAVRHRGAGPVHPLGEIARREVPDELAGFPHVAQAVLRRGARKADDRRMIVERVEEAVRCEIDRAVAAARGNPADRARAHDCVQRIVRQAVALRGFVIVVGRVRHDGARAADKVRGRRSPAALSREAHASDAAGGVQYHTSLHSLHRLRRRSLADAAAGCTPPGCLPGGVRG